MRYVTPAGRAMTSGQWRSCSDSAVCPPLSTSSASQIASRACTVRPSRGLDAEATWHETPRFASAVATRRAIASLCRGGHSGSRTAMPLWPYLPTGSLPDCTRVMARAASAMSEASTRTTEQVAAPVRELPLRTPMPARSSGCPPPPACAAQPGRRNVERRLRPVRTAPELAGPTGLRSTRRPPRSPWLRPARVRAGATTTVPPTSPAAAIASAVARQVVAIHSAPVTGATSGPGRWPCETQLQAVAASTFAIVV